jgi:branched-chain amino acid transport system ATP-binding protein
VAIIGANGAGKTTLLRGIAGLEPLASGRVIVNGTDCTQLPAHKRLGVGVALSPEGRGVFPDQTVRENLLLGGYALRKDHDFLALPSVVIRWPEHSQVGSSKCWRCLEH